MKNNPILKPYLLIFIAVCVLAALLGYHRTTSKPEATVIRIHDDQIDIQKLTNEIARFILVHGYGYQVQLVESTIKEVHDRLVAGDIDITLELWKENNVVWFDTAKGQGEVVDLGLIYSGGHQYWIIPKWYAEKHKIKTIFDMKTHWRDFTNPEDPSKGIFFNCIFGWSCQDINRVKLRAYGLDRYFNTVSPASPEALESIYENALMHDMPVFGYYWEPNALIASHQWYALEEPKFDQETWEKIIRAANDPSAPQPQAACRFKQIGVYKMANRKLLDKAPDAVRMMEKMNLNTAIFNNLLFSSPKTDQHAIKAIAHKFFTTYPDTWQAWVTDEAREKINAALKNATLRQ